MPETLKNKIAIVTGASRGIGAAIAYRFAAEGAKLVISARTVKPDGRLPGSLEETAARIRATGAEVHCVQADLGDPADRARIVPEAIARFGAVDVLVNNAAWARFRPTVKQTPKDTHLAFEINYFAPLELSQQAIPSMIGRGGGWILNLSSATSKHPEPAPYDTANRYFGFHVHSGPTLYGSTKAALERMSAGFAAELAASGIAVNTLAPARGTLGPLRAEPAAAARTGSCRAHARRSRAARRFRALGGRGACRAKKRERPEGRSPVRVPSAYLYV